MALKCPHCGSDDTYYSHDEGRTEIYKCRKCGQSFPKEGKGGFFGFGILGSRKEHYPSCRRKEQYGDFTKGPRLQRLVLNIRRKNTTRDEIIRVLDEVANQVAKTPKETIFNLEMTLEELF